MDDGGVRVGKPFVEVDRFLVEPKAVRIAPLW
jgi:hypothetical protein